jgi:hypothetical protein
MIIVGTVDLAVAFGSCVEAENIGVYTVSDLTWEQSKSSWNCRLAMERL